MKKLIRGIVDFRKKLTKEKRDLFAKLALGQKPDALFVTCSDSRVAPNFFASTNPGDLFVLRNVGNLIPPAKSVSEDSSAAAAIEFALFSLNVSDIIICGHSECGAMKAIEQGVDQVEPSHLRCWLKYGEETLKHKNLEFTPDSGLSKVNQLSQLNVLQQLRHISSHPFVKERLNQKKLRIHGWWFDIAQADVYCYEPECKQFVLIDEKESKEIIKRLG